MRSAVPCAGPATSSWYGRASAIREFLAEFATEIRMVAFDMLVHHLVAEHDETADRQAADEQNDVSDRRETTR